jgi:hypothetical protein
MLHKGWDFDKLSYVIKNYKSGDRPAQLGWLTSTNSPCPEVPPSVPDNVGAPGQWMTALPGGVQAYGSPPGVAQNSKAPAIAQSNNEDTTPQSASIGSQLASFIGPTQSEQGLTGNGPTQSGDTPSTATDTLVVKSGATRCTSVVAVGMLILKKSTSFIFGLFALCCSSCNVWSVKTTGQCICEIQFDVNFRSGLG